MERRQRPEQGEGERRAAQRSTLGNYPASRSAVQTVWFLALSSSLRVHSDIAVNKRVINDTRETRCTSLSPSRGIPVMEHRVRSGMHATMRSWLRRVSAGKIVPCPSSRFCPDVLSSSLLFLFGQPVMSKVNSGRCIYSQPHRFSFNSGDPSFGFPM